jgi:uncharacterized HAD superfamily protein
VEDAIHNAEDIAASGIPVLLFDAPWNKGWSGDGAIRVYSWDVIPKLALDVIGEK